MSLIVPEDSVFMPLPCATVQTFQEEVFCAPFTGNSIVQLSKKNSVNTIVFTDEPRVRIVNFAVTPFAFFINNGQDITRYFRRIMDRLTLLKAAYISMFAITRSEELIYADTRARTVHFLDYTGSEKMTLEDIVIQDMVVTDTLMYLLTPSHILIYDSFGNEFNKYALVGSFDCMHVQDNRIFLCLRGHRQLSMLTDQNLVVYDLPFVIQDITGTNNFFYALNDRGTILYRFDNADF